MLQVTAGCKMSIFRNISMTFVLMVMSIQANAQLRIFAPDSSILSFDTKHIVAETMDEDYDPVTYTFSFRNTGMKKVRIDRVQTTCSCAYAYCDSPVVSPGGEAVISVRFSPKGHPGKFDRKIYVYTRSEEEPVAVLTLSVDVQNSMDLSGQYPISMGDIRLKGAVVKFRKGVAATETLRFVNVSGRSLKFDCDRALLPDCLRFYAEPVRPLKEGVIRISYDPSKGGERDEMVIILPGIGGTPSGSSIKVIIEE